MAQETSHDELLTTGAEFRDLRLFGRQPNDQVDPTMWHAVAAEVKSELANSREHGDSDDTLEVENEGAAGKKKNAKYFAGSALVCRIYSQVERQYAEQWVHSIVDCHKCTFTCQCDAM